MLLPIGHSQSGDDCLLVLGNGFDVLAESEDGGVLFRDVLDDPLNVAHVEPAEVD